MFRKQPNITMMKGKAQSLADTPIPRHTHHRTVASSLYLPYPPSKCFFQFLKSISWCPCCSVLLGGGTTHIPPTGTRCLPRPGLLTQVLPQNQPSLHAGGLRGKGRYSTLHFGFPEHTDNFGGNQCETQNVLLEALPC